jgi:hypothetical protein
MFAFFPTMYVRMLLGKDNFVFPEVRNVAAEHSENSAVDVEL